VNLDISSTFNFGNTDALRHFMLDHRFVHELESVALKSKFNAQQSTFGLGSSVAEAEWAELMRGDPGHGQAPPALRDWLLLHAEMHVQAYTLLGQSPTFAPDLSVVDFSVPGQFYDWMYAHQQMHDWEQSQLGLQ
jgi:hypothetical protein